MFVCMPRGAVEMTSPIATATADSVLSLARMTPTVPPSARGRVSIALLELSCRCIRELRVSLDDRDHALNFDTLGVLNGYPVDEEVTSVVLIYTRAQSALLVAIARPDLVTQTGGDWRSLRRFGLSAGGLRDV